jgi:hypothetical protein
VIEDRVLDAKSGGLVDRQVARHDEAVDILSRLSIPDNDV